jgi:hypothetical protein
MIKQTKSQHEADQAEFYARFSLGSLFGPEDGSDMSHETQTFIELLGIITFFITTAERPLKPASPQNRHIVQSINSYYSTARRGSRGHPCRTWQRCRRNRGVPILHLKTRLKCSSDSVGVHRGSAPRDAPIRGQPVLWRHQVIHCDIITVSVLTHRAVQVNGPPDTGIGTRIF